MPQKTVKSWKPHLFISFISSQVYWVGLANKKNVSEYSEFFTEVQKLEEVKWLHFFFFWVSDMLVVVTVGQH